MPLTFMPDPRLYTDYNEFAARFHWPAAPSSANPILFHCYWSGPLTHHHELSLKSLLVTQSPPFEVWLWMPPESLDLNRSVIDAWSNTPAVKFRAYVPEEEGRGTIFEGHIDLLRDEAPTSRFEADQQISQRKQKPRAVADGLRLLVLGNYGGVYFDLDTLFLKDLRPLCSAEFCYQWSNHSYANNAVSHFNAGSPALNALAERALSMGVCHPAAILAFSELGDLGPDIMVLPSFTFDPVWIAHDTRVPINDYCNSINAFFMAERPVNLASFFPAAYAYHWHNRWKLPFKPGTIVGQLWDEVRARFAASHQCTGVR
jgi:hypothetical protein